MTDFLLELRSEEIPARMQADARTALERLFRERMSDAGVAVGDITVWSTPRRLALIARDLPEATEAVREETKGPATAAPQQALDGFLRKVGLTKDQLEVREIKGKETWFAVVEKPGRAVKDVLAEAIPAVIRAFPWPKSMRWGAASISTESLRWVRPLSGIVAIFGEELVECEIEGIRSGYVTRGHRFHHPDEITIGSAADYADKLRACHVIVDHTEREAKVRTAAAAAASHNGLDLVEDEGLVIENAGLTEWPMPLLGRFDEEYLEVPPEVIQLTARTNQKYFICRDKAGNLANAFVCTANIEASDGGEAIVAGNRKVLAARLSDARFFWDVDRKKTLEEHARGLERITFHEKLGTVADKVERVAKLARWLVEQEIVTPASPVTPAKAGVSGSDTQAPEMPASAGMTKEELADQAERAARLCKADLVTEMVGEFPELQGLMGGYYASAEGLPDTVADAVRDHYKPVSQAEKVPEPPVTVSVSLADKLDTLLAFFDIEEFPTGSKDPYALRRAAIAIIRLILHNRLEVHTDAIVEFWKGDASAGATDKLATSVTDFVLDRLAVQLKELGIRHDCVVASRRWQSRDDGRIDRVGKRAQALQSFLGTEDGANLLAGYKRAANILKKEDWRGIEGEISRTGEEDPLANVDDPDLAPVIAAKMEERHAHETALTYTPEPAEKALIDALDTAGPKAAAAVEAEDFAGAMAALASLRGPIDAFFDSVTVNDPDEDKRAARLALLDRFRVAVHNVADFSKIEG